MKRLGMLAALALAACGSDREVVVGEDYQRVLEPLARETRALDVLFVVDTSGSMLEEQRALVDAAGAQLFAQLAEDLGGPPDLHVAIVSTDVGVGVPGVPGCPETSADGRFQIGGGAVGCGIDGSYLRDVARPDGSRDRNFTGTITEAFSCAATLGTTGCGFEQPLEAVRRALDGRYPEHAGFLRADALLLVVFLTDEDDCSALDPQLYAAGGPLGPLSSFRCFEHGVVCEPDDPRTPGTKAGCVPRDDSAYLHPIATYAGFLGALKPVPGMVMLAGMYGPPDTVEVGTAATGGPELRATCAAPGTGVEAAPAIRLDAVVQAFPSRFVFESMCESGMSTRLARITRSTSGVMSRRPCLLGRLDATTTTGRCRAFAVGADGTSRTLPGCRSDGEQGCFVVAPSAQCDYTPSGVAATYRGTLAAGERMIVECLAPAS